MEDKRSLLNEPEQETAAQAFARLDGRIAVMSRAVEHLAAERASIDIPDYSATLGQMNSRLAAVAQSLAAIAEKPAMQLMPERLAARMDAAAKQPRPTDSATLQQARDGHQEAAQTIRSLAGVIRNAHEQRRYLIWAVASGFVAGCVLWSILPGVVLRALPVSWHMPESMAAHIIGEETLWDAGARLMRAGNPDAWQGVTDAVGMRRDNLEAITGCEQRALKVKRIVRCTVTIR